MTSDDDDLRPVSQRGANFDSMSVAELEEFIDGLTREIEQARRMIEKKKAAQNAAAGFFKS